MSHIDFERLRRYYANQMSNVERNALELEALEDPFLKDAMDGFDASPASFDAFYKKHKQSLHPRNNFRFTIVISTALILIVSSVIIIRSYRTAEPIAINAPHEKTDPIIFSDSETEIEVISPVIDSMVAIPEEEQIKVGDVIKDQVEIKIKEPKKITEEKISVPELLGNNNEKLKPEKENWNWYQTKGRAIPTAYIHGFKVVDYREINRENKHVSYKRYELSGVAADQESENSNTELVEQEVELPYFNYLTKTMSFFEEQNFKVSLNRHLIILEQFPEDLNALFYSGLAYYNLGKYEESINFFEKVVTIDKEVFNQEAEWYRAKCLIQMGLKKDARRALEEIIMKGGFYVEEAIAMKSKL